MFSFKYEFDTTTSEPAMPFNGKVRKSRAYNTSNCTGAFSTLCDENEGTDTYIYLSRTDKDGHDVDNVFKWGNQGANTTDYFDAWLKIQRSDGKFIIFDVGVGETSDFSYSDQVEQIEDSNNNTIGFKFHIGVWNSDNAAMEFSPLVSNSSFDTADSSNCQTTTTPVGNNEVLTITYEFRAGPASQIPNALPDTSSGEKYFLKFNEGGQNGANWNSLTWEQDTNS